jgi:hypothetical protein
MSTSRAPDGKPRKTACGASAIVERHSKRAERTTASAPSRIARVARAATVCMAAAVRNHARDNKRSANSACIHTRCRHPFILRAAPANSSLQYIPHPDAVLGVAGGDVGGDCSDLGFEPHLSVVDEDALLSRRFWDFT